MKLSNCNIEVYNRLSTFTNTGRRKSQRSLLAIGRQSIKSDEIYLLLQTPTNKNGTKYKVNNNIEKIFTKFINEGKATIRLKEPPHDLNIQSDVIQLKSFLHLLKLGLTKKQNLSVLNLSNLNPKKITAPKTKVIIKQASDYPVLAGFPRITEELHLSGLQRKSFDRQILKLQSLRILNLSQNQLTSIPQELGALPNLQELNLSDNLLGKNPISKWSWLNGLNISKTLRSLNLNSNQLTKIPDQINKLHHLHSLFLNNNSLKQLPQSIGSLTNLKFLNLAKNNLNLLPGSLKNLRLSELDVSDNPFEFYDANLFILQFKVPTLLDLAAQCVLKAKLHYDSSIIPYTLVPYLDKANYCICGSPCFDSYSKKFMQIGLSSFADSTRFSHHGRDIIFECYLCFRCLKKYSI